MVKCGKGEGTHVPAQRAGNFFFRGTGLPTAVRKNQPLVPRSNLGEKVCARTNPWFRGQTLLVLGHGGGGYYVHSATPPPPPKKNSGSGGGGLWVGLECMSQTQLQDPAPRCSTPSSIAVTGQECSSLQSSSLSLGRQVVALLHLWTPNTSFSDWKVQQPGGKPKDGLVTIPQCVTSSFVLIYCCWLILPQPIFTKSRSLDTRESGWRYSPAICQTLINKRMVSALHGTQGKVQAKV